MVNVYSSPLHFRVLEQLKELFQLMETDPTRVPYYLHSNRLRVQLPGDTGENSHQDWNGVDWPGDKIGMIVSLTDGRRFTYVKGSHTEAFHQNLRKHYKYARKTHYVQYHLENPKVADPCGMRKLWESVVVPAGHVILFHTAMVHRIAGNSTDKAVWSIFVSFQERPADFARDDGKYATPPADRRTVFDLNYACRYQPSGHSLRDANLVAWLLNYQAFFWPSWKKCAYYKPYAKPKLKAEHTIKGEPVWPAGIGCDVNWRFLDKVKLQDMKIPDYCYKFDKWAIDPTLLSNDVKRWVGLTGCDSAHATKNVLKRQRTQ
jgi:hypothetical protein